MQNAMNTNQRSLYQQYSDKVIVWSSLAFVSEMYVGSQLVIVQY